MPKFIHGYTERTVIMTDEMNTKVYCFDCLNYETSNAGGMCTVEIGYVDTPFTEQIIYADAEEYNRNNDCPEYAPRRKNRLSDFLIRTFLTPS